MRNFVHLLELPDERIVFEGEIGESDQQDYAVEEGSSVAKVGYQLLPLLRFVSCENGSKRLEDVFL